MAKHLIVMSVDAMVCEDLEQLRQLPHFGRLLEEGSRVERVRSIYPTLTHPIHTTLLTGCYPDRTGVCNNEVFGPGNPSPRWINSLSEIRVDTILHAAKRAGMTTACSRWPVTANGGEVIDYLVPEVMDADLTGELPEVYRRLGSGPILEEIVLPNIGMLDGNRRPGYDAFEIKCAADILRRYRPNLLMVHPGLVDSTRHGNGLFNEKVDAALRQVDEWLGWLMDAAGEAGIAGETSFVVLSDHGHLEYQRSVCLNAVLVDEGLIQLAPDGSVAGWDAWVQSAGLSAQVYLRDPGDEALKNRVEALLHRLGADGLYGFERIFTAEEAEREYHLGGGFSFVLETDGFTSFEDDWRRPVMRVNDDPDFRVGRPARLRSNHGHLPEKGPQPPFLCMGPAFRRGVVLERGNIADEAPTMAKALGLTLPEADGKAMEELLR